MMFIRPSFVKKLLCSDSDKNFEELAELYAAEFSDAKAYDQLKRNCSSGVNFILDHLFDLPQEKTKLSFSDNPLYFLCCFGCFGARCITPPKKFNYPEKIFKKGKKLLDQHDVGNLEETDCSYPAKISI